MGKTDVYVMGDSTIPYVPSTSSQEGVSGFPRSEYSDHSIVITLNQNLFGRPEAPKKPHGQENVNHFQLDKTTILVAFLQREMIHKSPTQPPRPVRHASSSISWSTLLWS